MNIISLHTHSCITLSLHSKVYGKNNFESKIGQKWMIAIGTCILILVTTEKQIIKGTFFLHKYTYIHICTSESYMF